MEEYRIEKEGSVITIWDDNEGIGIRFKEGEMLQLYEAEIILMDLKLAETEEGSDLIIATTNKLKKYAIGKYPKEFRPLKGDESWGL